MRVWWGALLGLAACGAGAPKDDGEGAAQCGDQAPVVEDFTIEDDGTAAFNTGEQRVLRLSAWADDEDGDLYAYTVQIWFDGFLDGVLSPKPAVSVQGSINDGEACNVKRAQIGAFLPFGNTNLPFGEKTEFGFRVLDAAGHASSEAPLFKVFTVPSE